MKSVVLVGLLFGSGVLVAGVVRDDTSLFEKPTEASRQIDILQKGWSVLVTGEREGQGGIDWIPVKYKNHSGWTHARKVTLENGDVGYLTPDKRPAILRVWTGGGLVRVSNPTDGLSAFRLCVGLDIVPTPAKLFFGFYLAKPFVTESFTTTDVIGRIISTNPTTISGTLTSFFIFATAGYFFIPEKFWVRGAAGQNWVSSSDTTVASRLTNALGLGIGYKIKVAEQWGLGLEGSYDYRGGDSILSMFSSFTGTFPKANFFSLNLVLDHNL